MADADGNNQPPPDTTTQTEAAETSQDLITKLQVVRDRIKQIDDASAAFPTSTIDWSQATASEVLPPIPQADITRFFEQADAGTAATHAMLKDASAAITTLTEIVAGTITSKVMCTTA